MSREKILVPVGVGHQDFDALYHALSVAERVQAKVYVFYIADPKASQSTDELVIRHLKELVAKACQEGLAVSFHMAHGSAVHEAVELINDNQIDLIVFESDGRHGLVNKTVEKIIAAVEIQVVRVNGKTTSTYRRRKDELRCRSS